MITMVGMAADALGQMLADDFRRKFGSAHVDQAERLDSIALAIGTPSRRSASVLSLSTSGPDAVCVQIDPQLGARAVDPLAERHPVELVHRPVEALDDSAATEGPNTSSELVHHMELQPVSKSHLRMVRGSDLQRLVRP